MFSITKFSNYFINKNNMIPTSFNCIVFYGIEGKRNYFSYLTYRLYIHGKIKWISINLFTANFPKSFNQDAILFLYLNISPNSFLRKN